jgi:small subunit ribosomal protein S9
MKEYYFGTGRRKTSIAQARVFSGTGKIFEKQTEKAPNINVQNEANRVIDLLGLKNKYDISLILKGGGVFSQADAVRLALSRAFSKIDEQYESMLKKEGFLTRDPREKERKKPGLKRARRAPQWAKR